MTDESTAPIASPASAAVSANRQFALFDSMRAIAVLFVVAMHVGAVSDANVHAWYGALTARGNFGVTLFFLISGFLLYRPFVAEHLGGRAPPPIEVYAERRALRILPAYWFALTVLAIWPGLDGLPGPDWWIYYFILSSYSETGMFGGLPVSWSLSVEVAFYVALPFIAWALGRLSSAARPGRTVALQCTILGCLGLLSAVTRVWAWQVGPWNLPSTFPFLFLWFAAGMILAILSAWIDRREDEYVFSRFVANHGDLVWLAALVLFAVFAYSPLAPRGVLRTFSVTGFVVQHVVYAIVSFGLLLPAVFGEGRGGIVRRLLGLRALDALGRISYGVFLWHHTLMLVVDDWLPLDSWPAPYFPTLFAATLGVSVAAAWVSYRFVEAPFMAMRRGGAPHSRHV